MADRIPLIMALSEIFPSLKDSAHTTALAAADKLVMLLLCQTPLPMARAKDEEVKAGLAHFLQESASIKDLMNVSKLWDPQRSVADDISSSDLARDLADLLFERRHPYTLTTLTLAEARALDDEAIKKLKRDLQRFASPKQLKTIKAKWDKHADLAITTSAWLVEHLCALLDGANEPVQPPSPKPKARKKS